MFNLVPRALFPGFGGGAGKIPGKSALGMKLIKYYVNFLYICSAVLSVISIYCNNRIIRASINQERVGEGGGSYDIPATSMREPLKL